MGNNNYARGAAFERKVKEFLESRGYYAVRAAGSHGLTDVVAIAQAWTGKQPLFIQCKTGKASMSLADKEALSQTASAYGAIPLLASPGLNGSIDFRWIGWDGTLHAVVNIFKEGV